MIFSIQENFAYISMPDILFDCEKLIRVTENTGVKVHKDNNDIRIIYYGDNASLKIRQVFSRYHDISINFLDYRGSFVNSSSPLVSCIILLNSNYDFVNELTIPGIIFNSLGAEIEIIVVHNGSKPDYEFDHKIIYTESEKSNIPKAYNNAARIAKGKYLAFFHDDCFLSDPAWIQKCTQALNDKVVAVGPEYHEFKTDEDYIMRQNSDKRNEWEKDVEGGYLKEVPLVMCRDEFIKLGGFPEIEILGQEDIFLHQNILNSGKENKQVDITSYHFTGISTLSLFSTKKELIQGLCNHFIFSKVHLRGLMIHGFDSVVKEKIDMCQKLYVLNLHNDDLSPWCKKIEEIGSAENLDTYMPMCKHQNDKVKRFIDGTVKAFMTIEDERGLNIITEFVDFNEILLSYINVISQK